MSPVEHDLRGRFLAQMCWAELEKIASAAGAPQPSTNSGGLVGGVQQGSTVDQGETTPAHGVVASQVEQLDPKRAVGIPVIQPPPGYVYAPELVAFVPDEQDPGWMPPEVAAEAARNKSWYDQGQQDQTVQKAQQNLDEQVSADADAAAAEQQQEQSVAQQDQAMMASSKQKAMDQAAKQEMGVAPPPKAKTPGNISGKKSSPKKSGDKKDAKSGKSGEGSGKGVTIKIGMPEKTAGEKLAGLPKFLRNLNARLDVGGDVAPDTPGYVRLRLSQNSLGQNARSSLAAMKKGRGSPLIAAYANDLIDEAQSINKRRDQSLRALQRGRVRSRRVGIDE